jgi:acetyl esterase/lipase
VADVNYGVRWMKANAGNFGGSAGAVGSMGSSSGGHLALLTALKPVDPRFAAIPLAGDATDASVPFVVALWPIVCPAQRHTYLLAHDLSTVGVAWPTTGMIDFENAYWCSADAMAEGSPLLSIERGDAVELPAVLCVQGRKDPLHPRPLLDRFVKGYAGRGGSIELELVRGDRYDELRVDVSTPESQRVLDRISAFIHNCAQGA